jgi:hypothetical protein
MTLVLSNPPLEELNVGGVTAADVPVASCRANGWSDVLGVGVGSWLAVALCESVETCVRDAPTLKDCERDGDGSWELEAVCDAVCDSESVSVLVLLPVPDSVLLPEPDGVPVKLALGV